MSRKISITLDDEVLDFVDQLASNRSRVINQILWQEKQRILTQELENAYRDQANDRAFQAEIVAWDTTVGDGLNA
jgi:predicted transcriptional regulator